MNDMKAFAPPILDRFLNMAKCVQKDVTIISPFITTFGIRNLVRVLPDKPLKN